MPLRSKFAGSKKPPDPNGGESIVDPASIQRVFAAIAPRYDFANHLLSFGLDFWWRKQAADLIAASSPERILDVATGSGDLALALSRRCPKAIVVGADFCLPMLQIAQRKGVKHLVVADALHLPFPGESFDALTVAFGLRNMPDRQAALEEFHRLLRPGGMVLVLDFSMPGRPLRPIYRWYLHHCLPAIAAWVTRERAAYEYLGDSIENFPQGEEMITLLQTSGFNAAMEARLAFGIVSIYTAQR